MIIIFLITAGIAFVSAGVCPKSEIIYPCKCQNDDINDNKKSIYCGGEKSYNLKRIFEETSKALTNVEDKHYFAFRFNNSAISEFEENTFHDITFEKIFIEHAKNLTKIHSKAFNNKSANLINEFICWSDIPLLNSVPPDYDLFAAFRSLVNIEEITLHTDQITEVPEHAFKNLTKLRRIDMSNSKSLETIGDYAFSDLINLNNLFLHKSSIGSIKNDAFHYTISTNNSLVIVLNHNRIINFDNGTFANAKRPLSIDLSWNLLSSIEKNSFGAFLDANPNNRINVAHNQLDCSSCDSYEFVRDYLSQRERVRNTRCTNGHDLWDSVRENCH